MLYVILLKQDLLIKKSLLAGFLFWVQAGVISVLLVLQMLMGSLSGCQILFLFKIFISNQLYKTKRKGE